MWVGISAVGAFADRGRRRDLGRAQQRRPRRLRPEPDPEFGQCVHKLFIAAGGRDLLYQQNHCGVYRTDDGGRHWAEITAGLPCQFGFPMVAHPRDAATACPSR